MGSVVEMTLQTRLQTCAATLCAHKVVDRLARCSSANRPASRGALLRFIRGAAVLKAHVLNARELVWCLIDEGFDNQDLLLQAQVILKACDADPQDTAKVDEYPDAKNRILQSAKRANVPALPFQSLVVWILSQSYVSISVSNKAILERLLATGCVQESINEGLVYHLCLDKLTSEDAWLFTERSLPPDVLPKRKARDIFEMHLSPPESPSAASCVAEANVRSFEELGLNKVLVESLRWHGLQNPSVIQQHCLAPLLQGRDVVAQAPCGTGKTIALAIAAIQQIDYSDASYQHEQRCPAGHCFKKVFAPKPCRVWAGCSCAGCESLAVSSPRAQNESKSPCRVCGCTSRFDSFGDRICWCDSCWNGCTPENESKGPCGVCGCSSRFDSFGDRICWCDSCWHGCIPESELELDSQSSMEGFPESEQGVHCMKCSWYLCRGCHEQQADALLQQITTPKCQAVVVVPTRELAKQIRQTVVGLGRNLAVRCHTCIGGTSVRDDINALRRGQHIVVGNPGRMFDMMSKRHLKVDSVKLCILDEWDALASDNMRNQVYDIFKCLPCTVQCGVFSTAMPSDVLKLTTKFMRDPVNILSKEHLLMPAQVRHFYMVGFDGETKVNRLLGLWGFVSRRNGVMVFCKSRREVDFVMDQLGKAGVWASCLHAELDQRERDLVMREFRKRTSKVLVCTNEFGRGLNMPHVRLVVNYDVPSCAEDYLLRSGRCGRFGRDGLVITFVSKQELPDIQCIGLRYRMRIEAASMEMLYESQASKQSEEKQPTESDMKSDTEDTPQGASV